MAQYMRHDCLEISCVKSNANFSSEFILVNIGKALDLDINDNDISIAHPLPSYSNEALPKIIVKFTRRDVRVYGKRNTPPELKPSQRPDLMAYCGREHLHLRIFDGKKEEDVRSRKQL